MWYVAITCDALEIQLSTLLDEIDPLPSIDDVDDIVRSYLVWNLAELTDQIKKAVYYGKPIAKTEARTHLQFIVSALAKVLPGIVMHDALQRNVDKLKARYPEGFTSENALNRDLDTERQVLES